jgi:hypothetical protein
MGKLRRCRAMRQFREETLECDRRYAHRKRHRARWREGIGARFVDITVRWPNRS